MDSNFKPFALLDSAFVRLPPELPSLGRLETWLAKGYAGEMDWMRKSRNDFQDFQSAWIGLWSYPRPLSPTPQRVAAYAHGPDYHFVVKEKLRQKAEELGEREALPFVDSYPLAERELAALAGLGFIGKNTMLIHPKYGSAFFIGGLLLKNFLAPSIAKDSQEMSKNKCSHCRKCVEACPGRAITEDGFVNANLCASYLTIEKRRPLTETEKQICAGRVFGCDICQTVCPYNKKRLQNTEPYFADDEVEWRKRVIKGTPLMRAGKRKLKEQGGAEFL
jgi:epoxyqueuosine reductase